MIGEKLIIPWGVLIMLPAEILRKYEESLQDAILYCASEGEILNWLDWTEREDEAYSFTNQLLNDIQKQRENDQFKKNLQYIAFASYKKVIFECYKKEKAEKKQDALMSPPIISETST